MSSAIDFAEENFKCSLGPACAFFDVGASVGENTKRVTYVAYAAGAEKPEPLDEWMLNNVLRPLSENGGHSLYWRSPEKIERYKPDDLYRIYTRIAVLDKDLEPVVIDDMVKPEGYEMRKLEDGE